MHLRLPIGLIHAIRTAKLFDDPCMRPFPLLRPPEVEQKSKEVDEDVASPSGALPPLVIGKQGCEVQLAQDCIVVPLHFVRCHLFSSIQRRR